MATISSAGTGLWSSTGTWSGGVVPGNGDVALIQDGHTVTVDDTRTIGLSGATSSTTFAVHTNTTGTLTIASGGHLICRGNCLFTADFLYETTALTVQGGGILEFDSSQATTPLSQTYIFGADTTGISGHTYSYRHFQATGSSGNRATVKSNTGGGAGYFSINGNTKGGWFQATYTDFDHIGDATNWGWNCDFQDNSISWDVTHCTFNHCGEIHMPSFTFADIIVRHSNNVHTLSQSSDGVMYLLSGVSSPGTGVYELKNNVFDASGSVIVGGFTIEGNYFGNRWIFTESDLLSFKDNFCRTLDGLQLLMCCDFVDSYLYVDASQGNPHVLKCANTFATNLTGCIFGQGGNTSADQLPANLLDQGGGDSGELFWGGPSNTLRQYAMSGTIALPNMCGYSSLELGSLQDANILAVCEHNTYFGGFSSGYPGFGTIDLSEGSPTPAGAIHSYRSNILWNPGLVSYPAHFFKCRDITTSGSPTTDIGSPTNVDYNCGFGHDLTDTTNTARFTNQGKGYAAKWSATPGTNDVDTNPMFFDYQRTVELWDSRYLGNTATAWSGGASYSVGDMVSHSRTDVYWSLPVNYRYIGSGSNPEPGLIGQTPDWRTCWEWASLYRLRTAIAAGTTYTDSNIGASGDVPTLALIKWIRTGYRPTNVLLKNAGHDGTTIGAEPFLLSQVINESTQLWTAALNKTTTKKIAASTQTCTTSLNKGITKTISAATQTWTANLNKAITKIFGASTQTWTATLNKTTTKIVNAATATWGAALTALKTGGGTVYNVIINVATQPWITSLNKATTKTISAATPTWTSTLNKSTSKVLNAATAAWTASLVHARIFTVNIAVSTLAWTTTLGKAITKNVAESLHLVPSLVTQKLPGPQVDRYVWVRSIDASDQPVTRLYKDPTATLDYFVNWKVWLGTSADTISSVTWTVPAGIKKTNSTFNINSATIWLSGGVLNRTYQITCSIVTAFGRTEDHSFEIVIQHQ